MPPLPSSSVRVQLALGSYWLLFILLPLVAFVAWRRADVLSQVLFLPLLLLLMLVGEHGLRLWRKLWGLD